jgi:myo-inositol 2-dehydrogenase/D-chiro-inositol 1-dehydrogenase
MAAMPQPLGFCQFGAGRIGAIHAANLAAHPGARLRYVVDVNRQAAQALAERHGAAVTTVDAALADAEVDAVIVASSTDTHADLVEAAAAAGKAVFCEKPIDLSLARAERCLERVAATGVLLQIGFNRRFDPSFAALDRALRAGRIGKVETVLIVSRDPAPPPPAFVKVSGGLFRDMTIHDLDMARWLLGAEPVELYATASCLVDAGIGALGDVDTAALTLRTADGALALISNSRRAVYGYDQRLEVLGSGGLLRVENRTPTALEVSDATAVARDKPLPFFLERYAESYRLELDNFIDCVLAGRQPAVGARDGWAALYLAEAALESVRSGRPVALDRLRERAQ